MPKIKQKNVPALGAVIDSFVTSLPLLSLINFVSMMAVLWSTTIQPFAHLHIPWLNLWLFMGGMTVMVIVAMFITYKYILPSVWAFRYRQMQGKHD